MVVFAKMPVIEPASPELIYPPVYSPAVYGPWSYPDYPPFDMFPPGPDFGYHAAEREEKDGGTRG